MLAQIHVKSHLDNIHKLYNPCEVPGQAFRDKYWQKSVFWKADFHQKKQINGRYSRSRKFTYNVD